LHDAISCERKGTPALAVMTSEFVSAAELMSRVLGLPDFRFAVIEHPVSSATDSGLQVRAQTAIAALKDVIVTGSR
jgi:hypothetical protein